jgi:hypothetical protein
VGRAEWYADPDFAEDAPTGGRVAERLREGHRLGAPPPELRVCPLGRTNHPDGARTPSNLDFALRVACGEDDVVLPLLELVTATHSGFVIQHAHFRPGNTLQCLRQPKTDSPGRSIRGDVNRAADKRDAGPRVQFARRWRIARIARARFNHPGGCNESYRCQ